MSHFFYWMVALQVLVFPANMYLSSRIGRKLLAMHRENQHLDEVIEKDAEELRGIEALLRAQSDLVALQLAIRLQAPRYWYS